MPRPYLPSPGRTVSVRVTARRRRRMTALFVLLTLFRCTVIPTAAVILSSLLIVGLYNIGELILH